MRGSAAPLWPCCMPITATPCVQPRWSAGWRNSGCSGRSRGRAAATTTPTPNCCSEQRNTGLITRAALLPAKRRHANGWDGLTTGTTTGTATAASGLSNSISAARSRLRRSSLTGLSSTKKHASVIHDAGRARSVDGVNWRWPGSTQRHRKQDPRQPC